MRIWSLASPSTLTAACVEIARYLNSALRQRHNKASPIRSPLRTVSGVARRSNTGVFSLLAPCWPHAAPPSVLGWLFRDTLLGAYYRSNHHALQLRRKAGQYAHFWLAPARGQTRRPRELQDNRCKKSSYPNFLTLLSSPLEEFQIAIEGNGIPLKVLVFTMV